MTRPARPTVLWRHDRGPLLAARRPSLARLGAHLAVGTRRCFSAAQCATWVAGIEAARPHWVDAFDGEQFSLGRAFYTHLEQGQSRAYFDGAAASDASVERFAPGLQAAMRDLLAAFVGGQARQRRGFCGPGVHVFPAGSQVAREGGAVHFDTEGLTDHHLAEALPAVTLVAMLQPATHGGGLKVWDVLYDGEDHVAGDTLAETSSVCARYGLGDVVAIDSYRLHQIQPFGGGTDRISATVHGARIDDGQWEIWF